MWIIVVTRLFLLATKKKVCVGICVVSISTSWPALLSNENVDELFACSSFDLGLNVSWNQTLLSCEVCVCVCVCVCV